MGSEEPMKPSLPQLHDKEDSFFIDEDDPAGQSLRVPT